MSRTTLALAATAAAALAIISACSSDNTSGINTSGNGTVVTQLTDAPFSSDSVKSVDIFVTRVDVRGSVMDSAGTDHALTSDSASANGWTTLATPNASFNLLSLQNGITATLGSTTIPAGTYNSLRLIIDPTKSSVTLKNGTKLTNTSSPSVAFPSAAQSGIKVNLSQPVTVVAGTTTNLLVDFDVNNSFVQRGNTIDKNGLLFKPTIKATITNLATTNATVRLINATSTALSLNNNGTALTGANNVLFGTGSSCVSVPVSGSALTVSNTGTTTAIAGFTSPTLTAGGSQTFVAFPSSTGTVQFATFGNAFTPTTGQAGLRVFNATSATTGFDAFVTAVGAVLGTASVTNVLSGSSSAFVSVPAGTQQIRLTSAGSSTLLLDVGSNTLTAGTNYTLLIEPPAAGSTTPRAVLMPNC